jgi:transposase
MKWAKEHQICLAHLLRDVQYAIDAGDNPFAPRLHALLKKACAIGRRRDTLKDATLRTYASVLKAELDEILRIKPKCETAKKLQLMVKKYRQHFFVFVTNRAIPPTNNGSERSVTLCHNSAKSLIASDLNGAQSFTLTSDPSWKPPDAEPSARSTPFPARLPVNH